MNPIEPDIRIESVRLAKIFSFGPEQVLSDFRHYNLFIGPNGTGKSNILRIINGLPYDTRWRGLLDKVCDHQNGSIESDVFEPSFGELSNTAVNRDALTNEFDGILEIKFRYPSQIPPHDMSTQTIVFREDTNGRFQFIGGNVANYNYICQYIHLQDSPGDFFREINLHVNRISDVGLALLNYAMYYVFGLYYYFDEQGRFVQGKLGHSGTVQHEAKDLPSGVLHCARLVIKILQAWEAHVLLLDEPELHVEPRMIRRLFEYLIWYSADSKVNQSDHEKTIVAKVSSKLKQARSLKADIGFEKIPNAFSGLKYGRQLFIASHSPVLINQFLRLGQTGAIYEFYTERRTIKILPRSMVNTSGSEVLSHDKVCLFTKVRKVERYPQIALEGLGCNGSDMLQCNGVIWVEGPSDAIYIEKWLRMYARDSKCPYLIRGVDYEFQIYGGAILDCLCLIGDPASREMEIRKIVDMFSFSRNAYIVIDSDAALNEDGHIVDLSNFNEAKKRIKKSAEELRAVGFRIGTWFSEGNTERRTIEDYLDKESLLLASKSMSKFAKARKIARSWGDSKQISEFPEDLQVEIAKMDQHLRSWSEPFSTDR